jgi:hypothetical protein
VKILRGDRNQCPTCDEYFNSTYAFDYHRVGDYPDRRCLTKEEMLEKKMGINQYGFWVRNLMPRTLNHLRKD